jgi:hypothetical protein
MWFPSLFHKLGFSKIPGFAAPTKPRRALRLNLERLEARMLLSRYTAATVSDLIADINAANAVGRSNTIMLARKSVLTLTQVNNTSGGANGLPVIAAGDNLTIVGNNDTIERSYASGTPEFRLFDVASGASLTLENLTVQNGDVLDLPFPTQDYGGAIYSNGSLTLTGVIVTGNVGFNGAGVYIAGGRANLSNDTFTNNTNYNAAVGGGGAICVAGGTANLASDTFEHNGASSGSAPGTAIYVAAGASAVLTNSVVESNEGDWALFAAAGGWLKCCHDIVKGNDAGIYSAAVDQYTYDHCVGNGINFNPFVSIIQC